MNPLTWLVCYIGLEGVVRAVGTIAGGDAYGTLFLSIPYILYRKATARAAEPELPLVRDEITPGRGGDEIQIAACRPRPEWKYPFTIRYGGGYFQVVAEKNIRVGSRPFIYSLRRLPAGEIARGLREYDPADVLVQTEHIQPVELHTIRAQRPPQPAGPAIRQMRDKASADHLGLSLVAGPFVSLLPRDWRDAVFHQSMSLLIPGAIISGGAVLVCALLLLAAWFMGDLGVHWSQPQTFAFTLIVGYCGFEGLMRAYLALTAGEIHGTAVLGILQFISSVLLRPAARPKLPLVVDEVTPGGPSSDLKISSCREKRDWIHPYTIRFEGTFFQVSSGAYLGAGPRPYVYLLRRLQPGEIAGGLKDYDPREVLEMGKIDRFKW